MAVRLQRQLQRFLVDRQHPFVHCPSFRFSSVSLSFNPNSLHVDWIETKPRTSQHHWRQLVKWWCKELRRSAVQVPRSQLLKRTASFQWLFESFQRSKLVYYADDSKTSKKRNCFKNVELSGCPVVHFSFAFHFSPPALLISSHEMLVFLALVNSLLLKLRVQLIHYKGKAVVSEKCRRIRSQKHQTLIATKILTTGEYICLG